MREAWKRETYVRSQSSSSELADKYLHVGRRPLPLENKISQMPYPRPTKTIKSPPHALPPHEIDMITQVHHEIGSLLSNLPRFLKLEVIGA